MAIRCGIYVIENSATGQKYVGSSKNIPVRRKQHLRALELGRHHSHRLQYAWDKYGPGNFTFEVLFPCSEGQLLEMEALCIAAHEAATEGYNIQPNPARGGRLKGTPNKTTAAVRAVLRGIAESARPRVAGWIQRVAETDSEKAAQYERRIAAADRIVRGKCHG